MKSFFPILFFAAVAVSTSFAGPLDDLAAANKLDGRAAINTLRVASDVADGETVTIGSVVFEVDTAAAPGAITAGRVRVDCNAAVTPTAFTAALEAAINAANLVALKYRATKISASEVLIYNTVHGADTTACTETLAGTNNAWAAAAAYGGRADSTVLRGVMVVSRAANATEVALGTIHFVLPYTPTAIAVQVRTSAGVFKVHDGGANATGNRVTVDNTGSTDFAATDVITVIATN